MKSLSVILCAATLAIGLPALAMQPPAAPAAKTAPGGVLTINSTVGELIANPKTDAVLKQLIPVARANEMFATQGAGMSLKDVAQYETELTEAKLKEINEALAKAQAAK